MQQLTLILAVCSNKNNNVEITYNVIEYLQPAFCLQDKAPRQEK